MVGPRGWIPVALFAVIATVGKGQAPVPDHFPELKYPPIARAARVQGDVIVSFRQTPDGGTADVTPVSGPAMLQGVAVENVKAWRFAPPAEPTGQVYKAVFHFQLNPPEDGFDDNQPGAAGESNRPAGLTILCSMMFRSAGRPSENRGKKRKISNLSVASI